MVPVPKVRLEADGEAAAAVHADGGIVEQGERAGIGVVVADVAEGAATVAVEVEAVALQGKGLAVEVGLELESRVRGDNGAEGGAAQGIGIEDDDHACIDVGRAAVGVIAGEDDIAAAQLGKVPVFIEVLVLNDAVDGELGGGGAGLQGLGAVGTDDGVAGQDDGAGPDDGAGDGAEDAGIGLDVGDQELVHAQSVGAGGEGVEGLIELEVPDLNAVEGGAELGPRAGACRGLPDAVVGAQVKIAVARVEHELPAGHRGEGAGLGDGAPELAGVGRIVDLDVLGAAAVGDVGHEVDAIPVGGIDHEVHDHRSGSKGRRGVAGGPVEACVLGHADVGAVGDVDGAGVVAAGAMFDVSAGDAIGHQGPLVGSRGEGGNDTGTARRSDPVGAAVGGDLEGGAAGEETLGTGGTSEEAGGAVHKEGEIGTAGDGELAHQAAASGGGLVQDPVAHEVDDSGVLGIDLDRAARIEVVDDAADNAPGEVVVELGGAVADAAAEADVGVGGGSGNVVELGDRQVAVDVRPVTAGFAAPDTAVGSGHQRAVGGEGEGMVVGVRTDAATGGDVAPGAAAVRACKIMSWPAT